MGAGAVPHGVHDDRGELAVPLDASGEDRGAGRRGEFSGRALGVDGRAGEQLDDDGRGDRHRAVLGPGHAEPGRDGRGEDARDVEERQGDGRAHHVHQRVDGVGLVERHGLDLLAMHLGLGLGERAEDPPGDREGLGWEVGLVEERADAPVGADHADRARAHRQAERADALLLHLVELQVEGLEGELGEVSADLLEVRACVDEGRESHVAGDTGDAVEVGDPHAPNGYSLGPRGSPGRGP